jgi:hypothetical protein
VNFLILMLQVILNSSGCVRIVSLAIIFSSSDLEDEVKVLQAGNNGQQD